MSLGFSFSDKFFNCRYLASRLREIYAQTDRFGAGKRGGKRHREVEKQNQLLHRGCSWK